MLSFALLLAPACMSPHSQAVSEKLLIAHRGASAYAPEHTAAAYQLAVEQGADLVEQDLQVTRDGRLICLHDETLERTTDAEEKFPDRYREETGESGPVRRWYARDFDLEEIRTLDAGSWFGAEFAGERVLTFSEAIQIVRGKAGIFPELKAPEAQRDAGWDMEPLVVEALKQAGLFQPDADTETPVYLQSFDASSLRRLRGEFDCRLPLVLLIGRDSDETLDLPRLETIAGFADGIGPDKALLKQNPELAIQARRLGLDLFPWTFSRRRLDPQYGNLTEEMRHFLFTVGVQGLFTNNPDLFPRRF